MTIDKLVQCFSSVALNRTISGFNSSCSPASLAHHELPPKQYRRLTGFWHECPGTQLKMPVRTPTGVSNCPVIFPIDKKVGLFSDYKIEAMTAQA